MNVKKYRRNGFLKVDDIKAPGPIRVTIAHVSEGRFEKLNLTFHEGPQLSLNKTNVEALALVYGAESDDWLDKELELYVGETKYGGESQETILIKPISPPIANKAPPKLEFDDAIEF